MSANSVPRFVEQPKTWAVNIPAASPAVGLDGTATKTLVSAGNYGSKIEAFRFQSQAETIASHLWLFLKTSNNSFLLYDVLSISAASSPGGAVAAWNTELVPTKPVYLQANWSIAVGVTHTSAVIDCYASGGDY